MGTFCKTCGARIAWAETKNGKQMPVDPDPVNFSIGDVKDMLEDIEAEEQEAFDNMPESLQESEREERKQEIIDAMEECIQEIIDALNEYIGYLGKYIEHLDKDDLMRIVEGQRWRTDHTGDKS